MARAAEILSALALALGLAAGPAAAQSPDPEARTEALSARIICNCDCGNKIVATCYCGVADSLRQEIRARIAAGGSDDQVLAHFVARYGEQILAAPTPEGFNLTAWIAPGAALVLGLALAGLVLRRWARQGRSGAAPVDLAAAPAAADPYERVVEAEIASRRD